MPMVPTTTSTSPAVVADGARNNLQALDALIEHDFLERWMDAVEAAEAAAEDAGKDWQPPARPIIQSVEIPSCTPEDLIFRLSPDWPQISNPKESQLRSLGLLSDLRLWFSSICNWESFSGVYSMGSFSGWIS